MSARTRASVSAVCLVCVSASQPMCLCLGYPSVSVFLCCLYSCALFMFVLVPPLAVCRGRSCGKTLSAVRRASPQSFNRFHLSLRSRTLIRLGREGGIQMSAVIEIYSRQGGAGAARNGQFCIDMYKFFYLFFFFFIQL